MLVHLLPTAAAARHWARAALSVALAAVVALAGCESLMDGVGCDTMASAGLSITVRLGDGGEASCVAVVTITNGTITETLQAIGHPCGYFGAHERPGKWTVTAKQKGYVPATQTAIEVVQGECHVIGETVTLTLQPE